MADTNAFKFQAQISDADVRQAVRDELDNYRGTLIAHDSQTDSTLDFEAHDVEQGSVPEAFARILEVIRDGVDEFRCPVCKGKGRRPNDATADCLRCIGEGYYYLPVADFAFSISDEPQDEYLGQLHMHAPGLPDFSGDCDGNGTPVVKADQLLELITSATNLHILRAEVANLIGRRHLEYLSDAAGPETGGTGH